MNYNEMVERALRGVVRDALDVAAGHGIDGNHHFYISFDTRARGVRIPLHLRQRYDEEMTIVLQHQFWGLEVDEERFEVTLSFNRVHERLSIPFSAITAFADPSVQFGLQFRADEDAGDGAMAGITSLDNDAGGKLPMVPDAGAAEAQDQAQDQDQDGEKTGQVIALDTFRKKD